MGKGSAGGRSFAVRVIREGHVEGAVLACDAALSFYGGVDLDTGVVTEPGHPLQGRCIAGTVLSFSTGKGSTVGSYALYRLRKSGLSPLALLMERCEPIVAAGAIISDIPCVDRVPRGVLATGDRVRVEGDRVEILAAAEGPEGGRCG